MKVTLDEFLKDTSKYMELAKTEELTIMGSWETIVWTLRGVRDPWQLHMMKFIHEEILPEYFAEPQHQRAVKRDSFQMEC